MRDPNPIDGSRSPGIALARTIITGLVKAVFAALAIIVLEGCTGGGATSRNVTEAIDLANQGNAILNQQAPGLNSDAIWKKAAPFFEQALTKGLGADAASMNRRVPEFGDRFQEDFVGGLELFLEGMRMEDAAKAMEGQFRLDKWGIWYNANLKAIRGS